MKKKKRALNKLFQNNKFLIILALVISTITRVYMSMGTTNDTTVTISNIPIQIELPDQLDNNGLQVFRDAEQTATVTVTGSRAVLGSIGTKDITVTGATNGIDSAGTCGGEEFCMHSYVVCLLRTPLFCLRLRIY